MAEAKKTAAKKAAPAKKEVATKKAAPKKAAKPVVEEVVENSAPVSEEVVAQEAVIVDAEITAEEPKTAKAGKRSAKGLKEAEQKQAKEVRKAHAGEENPEAEAKPAKQAPKARPHHERAGKKYREAYKLINRTKEYTLTEAIELATKTSTTNFDSSVELHVRLAVDPRQADQNIRGQLVLPAGTGKDVRVAVFGDVEDVAAAKKAGADIAGADEFLAQLDKGSINFDVLVATPAMMPKLGKYARVLGPKGLMPNPKSGTVTKDVSKAVKEAKAGRVEYRVDSTGIVHLAVGKVSFGAAKLGENIAAVTASLKAAKPASVKGTYVKSAFITTSMGPSIRVANAEI
jgi:large subunit ribosomal protein L1